LTGVEVHGELQTMVAFSVTLVEPKATDAFVTVVVVAAVLTVSVFEPLLPLKIAPLLGGL
jgi:hypothetical protein